MAVRFLVDLAESHSGILKVKMEFPSSGKDEVVMPVWTPGSYLVRDFSRHLVRVEAKGKLKQLSKNRWQVETKRKIAEVNYEIYCDELTVDTSYADQSLVLINGASVFLYPEGKKDCEYSVKFLNLNGRKVSTSLVHKNGDYGGEDYDQLVDSPFLIGNQEIMEFSVMNKRHTIAWEGRMVRDKEEIVKDFKKIVEAEGKVFGELPYQNYVFIVVTKPDEVYGGLEHKNSTVIMTNEHKLIDNYDYKIFLTIVSHEFFHTWNVKRIRPKELGPFDYTREVYTNLLWLSEGFTSYYEWLILWRAGIVSEKEYMDHIGKMIDFYNVQPGHSNISADSSSFNTWIKLYKPDGNSINNYISYYLKGELIAFALNCEIAISTKGKKTLDDVFRALYEDFRKTGKGIEKSDLLAHLKNVGGEGMEKVIRKLTETSDEIKFGVYIKNLGYSVSYGNKENNKQPVAFIGMVVGNEGGKSVVRYALKDYPAYNAGVLAGDELVAVNAERFTDTFIKKFSPELWRVKIDTLKGTKPGDKVTLIVFRKNNLISLEMVASEELGQMVLTKHGKSRIKNKILAG